MEKPDRTTLDEMVARLEEDLASLHADFISKLLKAELGKQSTVIEEYIGDRFDVRAGWYLSVVHKKSQVEGYLATLDCSREKDVEALIAHFASSLPYRELVDARIVGRISYWKAEAMRRARESVGSMGSFEAEPPPKSCSSTVPAADLIRIELENDRRSEAVKLWQGERRQKAKAETHVTIYEEAGQDRSEFYKWLRGEKKSGSRPDLDIREALFRLLE